MGEAEPRVNFGVVLEEILAEKLPLKSKTLLLLRERERDEREMRERDGSGGDEKKALNAGTWVGRRTSSKCCGFSSCLPPKYTGDFTCCCFSRLCLLLSIVFLGHRKREMEEKKLSFVDEFFPEKEPALPSKSDILSTIFPPRSTVAVKDSFHYDVSALKATEQENEGQSLTELMGASSGSFQVSPGKNLDQDGLKKNNDPNVPCEIAEPCLMSSSVYYGGRDDFIPEISSSSKSDSTYNLPKRSSWPEI